MNLKISSKKRGEGTSLRWSPLGKLGKGFGIAFQSVVRAGRGFKILPGNDAKMLSHKL
jgi:hypothetical protein